MPSNKLARTNDDIQFVLSRLLPQVKDPRVQQMLSITAVDTAADLRTAKVYVSVFDKEKSAEVLKGLKSAAGYLRRQIGAALQLRHTPELIFIDLKPEKQVEEKGNRKRNRTIFFSPCSREKTASSKIKEKAAAQK